MTIDDKFINKRVRLFINQTMRRKRVEKKKLLGRHNKVVKWLFKEAAIKKQKYRSSHLTTDRKTPVLESLFNQNIAKFYRKPLFFFFSIYIKYLEVTNLLHLKYNKNTIIKTFYNTIPNIHLRHIR